MVPLLFEHGGQLVVSVVVQLVLGTANCSNKGRRARSLVATIWSQPREGWENEQDLGLRSRARSRDVQVQGEGDVSCYVTRAVPFDVVVVARWLAGAALALPLARWSFPDPHAPL